MHLLKRIYCRTYQMGFRAALPIMPYRTPKQLNGMGEIPNLLKEKRITSVLLVADSTVRSLGLIQSLEEDLKNNQIHYVVYEQKTPNPTIVDVETARNCYLEANAGAIIAIGGGSAMDCAKVAGARIARPGKQVEDMKGLLKILLPTPLLIAVPTTSGTGSEVTLAAVITDGKKHHKYPINDFSLIPNYAVLDPNLTVGLPPFVTATTGLDALTHAVEAYIGRSTNRYTRAMSEKAVRGIFESLEETVHNGGNREARLEMLDAAFCAGAAFTRSYVGYVHGIAHSLGGKYGIAHGLANAVILPVFLRHYGPSCEKKLARLARRSGVVECRLSDKETAERFIRWIEGMNEQFGIPTGFKEIRERDIDEMAGYADKESNPLYPVPRLMNKDELADVYRLLMC